MKTLYLIKHAKSDWSVPGESDMERDITKKGLKHINTMGSYLTLRGVNPDVILSSCALRAQETSNILAEKINFSGPKYFLQELYLSPPELIKEIIIAQDDEHSEMFIVGHNPQLSELVFMLSGEHIAKMPSLAIVAIKFDIQEWSELEDKQGEIDFFISPKQFKYYMPKQIRVTLKVD
ncbi:SixA phosphatase family protein [Sulfurimonas sp.]|uniref:SixA phosphatase family protein n=1 Tax=Sulfurimonas sp. TaxID=2022749 RepID=UPI002B489E6C|nr:histidine phosphatase family protein [Sulfurimonas sp.]